MRAVSGVALGGGIDSRALLVHRRALQQSVVGALVAIEQRVLLEFSVNFRREFQVGKLEQLDGLLQLRRHDQRLALAQFQSLRSEEHTSELQSLMRISYAVFCLKKKTYTKQQITNIKNTQ